MIGRALLALGFALALAGCPGAIRTTTTARTAEEQLLVSSSAERAIATVDASRLAGRAVFVDDARLAAVDRGYILSAFFDLCSRSGARIVRSREKADVIVEVRSACAGIYDAHWTIGIPAIYVAGLVAPKLMAKAPGGGGGSEGAGAGDGGGDGGAESGNAGGTSKATAQQVAPAKAQAPPSTGGASSSGNVGGASPESSGAGAGSGTGGGVPGDASGPDAAGNSSTESARDAEEGPPLLEFGYVLHEGWARIQCFAYERESGAFVFGWRDGWGYAHRGLFEDIYPEKTIKETLRERVR